MKFQKIFDSIAIIAMMTAAALLSGCKERVPATGTPAFDALHGIVNDGKTTNEITLINDRNNNHPKLRFPPEIAVGVDTRAAQGLGLSAIKKGYANEVHLGLDLTEQKRLIPIVKPRNHLLLGGVKVTLLASYGPETIQKTEERLREIARLSVRTTDKPEWGLRKYTPTINGNLQSFVYVPLDESFRSVDGVRIPIGCMVAGSTITGQSPAGCGVSFNHPSGAAVAYVFDYNLLPYWRQIYTEVYKFTDSVVVKLTGK